jgi:hypothetical protein
MASTTQVTNSESARRCLSESATAVFLSGNSRVAASSASESRIAVPRVLCLSESQTAVLFRRQLKSAPDLQRAAVRYFVALQLLSTSMS